MLFNHSHDFLNALVADALDLPEVFFNLPQVDGLAIILQKSVCVAHQEGLKFFTAHFLYHPVCVTVDNFLFCHLITPVLPQIIAGGLMLSILLLYGHLYSYSSEVSVVISILFLFQ